MTESPEQPHSAEVTEAARKPRVLWANCYCMMDVSSGAAMTVRTMLRQLQRSGWEAAILGCTVFDSERGTAGLGERWADIKARPGQFVEVEDGELNHLLYVTGSTVRRALLAAEFGALLGRYKKVLGQFKPDLVMYYGGQEVDSLIAHEARLRGIPVAFYLANGNYQGAHWCRDVDLVLTDSRATAGLYFDRLGLTAMPVGKFIEADQVVATEHTCERLLFINPKLEKGAGIVVQLAMLLEQLRPDIVIEVVESRGAWQQVLQQVTAAMGSQRDHLANVVTTTTTIDMRPVFGRARALLVPSLWWESGGRVAVEAMLNGIPAIVTDRGGLPEMIGDGGIRLRWPEPLHEAPYRRLLPNSLLMPLVRQIEQLYDNASAYETLRRRALAAGQRLHGIDASTARLLAAIGPLAARRAGDSDQVDSIQSWHRQGLRQPIES